MRVVFVTHYSSLYGANRSLLNLIDGLKKFGVESFALCPSKGQITDELSKRDVPFLVLPFKNWMSISLISRAKAPARLMLNLAVMPFLAMKVKKWHVDIIYSNSSTTPIGALISRYLNKPHVWHIREFGWLDYRLRHDWGEKIFQYWLNQASAIIAVSNAVKQVVLNDMNSKIHIIYNGVISKNECDILRKKAHSFAKKDKFNFAILGLISPNKGQEQAIKALANIKKVYPNTRLLIVGSGSENYVKKLKVLCKNLEVNDQVEFCGYIYNPFDAYLRADAILMCSKYEAMGRVTAEAMAAAKPVIGYNSAGTAELIEHELTGLKYDGSDKDLSDCMIRFLKNPNWALELGRNAWEKAYREFVIEIYAKRIYEVLQDVIRKAI